MKNHAWCITDGSAGMISQCIGLCTAMALDGQNKTVDIRKAWSILPSGWYPSPGWAIKNLEHFPLNQCPKYVISCGRRAVYISLYLKSKLGSNIVTIHIQDPKINSKHFDYVIAPYHDGISGSNIIRNEFAINHITQAILKDHLDRYRHHFQEINKPIILVTLGGKNRHFRFDIEDINKMCDLISTTTTHFNAHTIILFSRRTPERIKSFCHQRFSQSTSITVWHDPNFNPYITLLAMATYIIVTSDSTSMISEAVATQKPTYVYQLPLKKRKSRVQSFINHLLNKQVIAKLQYPLPTCVPVTVNETEKIGQMLISQINKI